jgi:hypothetical protein
MLQERQRAAHEHQGKHYRTIWPTADGQVDASTNQAAASV